MPLSGQCNAIVNNIDPVVSPPQSFSYILTGATTGSGSGTASGQTFNAGLTTVKYTPDGLADRELFVHGDG